MTRNLTTGPPARLILLFAVPLLIGNLFQQMYQFADAVVVGRILGVDALGAVGSTGGLAFLLLGFSWGLTNGFAIPTARAFGAGDLAGVRRSVAAGAVLSTGFALLITVTAVPASRALLVAMQTPPELLSDATTFIAVTFMGTGATVAFNFLAASIRALGDSRTPLLFLALACTLNVALSVTFVGGLGLGVAGAALATITAQLASVLACLALVRRRMPLLRLSRDDWRVRRADLREPLRIGFPMGFQMSIIAIGTLVLQYAVNGLGAASVAAFAAAARVDGLAVAPLSSFGIALATFVAQNRGARAWTRIRQGVLRTCAVSSGFAVVIGVVNVVWGPSIVRLFLASDDRDAPEVVALAHTFLSVNGRLYVALALLFALRNALQGMGRSAVPTLAGVMELVLRVAAAVLLVDRLGFLGACLAAPLAWFGALVPLTVAWGRERRRLAARPDGPLPLPDGPVALPDDVRVHVGEEVLVT